MTTPATDRRGFALPAAIAALVIIGVLITAGFYVSQQEVRIGTAVENAQLASYLNDVAVAEVVDGWNYNAMQALPLFGNTTFVDTLPYGDWQVDVFRIGSKTFFLNTQASITQGGALYAGADRRTGVMVRVLSLDVNAPAAITTRGDLNFNGSPPELSGLDRVPSGWGAYCPGPLQHQIGFLSDDSSSVMTASGGKGGKGGGGGGSEVCVSQVTGAPCSMENPTLVDEVMAPFQGSAWDELISMANHVFTGNPGNAGPVISGGVCDASVATNWGDPINPGSACGGYFPMIYFSNPGETRLTGNGRGQGIFLFEGDLHIGGNYELYGLVIVKGGINSAGTPAITGAIIADSTYSMSGNPDAFYSGCAVERAIFENANLTRARPMTNRSYIDLSNILSN